MGGKHSKKKKKDSFPTSEVKGEGKREAAVALTPSSNEAAIVSSTSVSCPEQEIKVALTVLV